jgi:RimJ/RimL family protein N-acetyltransferase
MPQIPLLEAPRLVLRPHAPADLDAATALWQHPDVIRYTSGRPFSREEVWARLLRYAGHWQWIGYGFWAIEDRASGEFIGEIGFAELKRALTPALDAPEAGWILDPRYHGRGYAGEALNTALAWSQDRFPSNRTVCMIVPENAASLRLAGKFGYREYARTAYKNQPVILLSR